MINALRSTLRHDAVSKSTFSIDHRKSPSSITLATLRWVLEHGLPDVGPATRYHYYRTVRVIAAVLGHWPDWEPHLRGSWTTPSGTGPPIGV